VFRFDSSDDAIAVVFAGERLTVPRTVVRLGGVGLVLAGFVHLLVPGVLLSTGRVAYDFALDVRFEPQEEARSRVRAVGLAMVAAGSHLAYYGGIAPREE
jgi:hypothetical protein